LSPLGFASGDSSPERQVSGMALVWQVGWVGKGLSGLAPSPSHGCSARHEPCWARAQTHTTLPTPDALPQPCAPSTQPPSSTQPSSPRPSAALPHPARPGPKNLSSPRILNRNPGIGKVRDIPSSQRSPIPPTSSRDLRVSHSHRATNNLPSRGDLREMPGSHLIKRQDLFVEVLVQQRRNPRSQQRLSLAIRQPSHSVEQLSCRHRGSEDLPVRKLIDPPNDTLVRHGSHQFRNHVGVENDHSGNSTTRVGSLRVGGSNARSPISLNRCLIREPMPWSDLVLVSTSARIARTSASMERPCSAARTRSLAFKSSSKSRMVSVATGTTPSAGNASTACIECESATPRAARIGERPHPPVGDRRL
jgi:hypothetical protein